VPDRRRDQGRGGAEHAAEHGDLGSEPARPALPDAEEQLARARAALAAARAAAGPRAIAGTRPGGTRTARSQPPGLEAGSAEAGSPEVGPGEPGSGKPALGPPALGPPGSGPPVSPRAARRERRDDPQALSTAIGGLLDAEGWNLAAATGSVFGRWPQIVGADLAGHTQPESLRDGELTVLADSTAWATQLRLLQAQLIRRLNAELGSGTVVRVKVRGPVTATRRPGEWRVRDSRGPRDTYG